MASSTGTQDLQALATLVKKYGAIEKIPLTDLKKAGFNSVADANKVLVRRDAIPTGPTLLGSILGNIGNSLGITSGTRLPLPTTNSGNLISRAIAQNAQSNATTRAAKAAANRVLSYQDSDKANRAKIPTFPTATGSANTVSSAVYSPPVASSPASVPLSQPSDFYGMLGLGNTVQYPQLPPPPQANFKINDFTNQANTAAAKAYSPLYAALDAQNKQDQANYATSKAVLSGIYNQLVDANQASAQDLNTSYNNAIQNSNNTTQQTQDSINQGYNASQQQLANLVKSFGDGGDVAASILARGAQDQGNYSAQAAQTGQQQANYLTNEQQAAGQYNNAITNANRTEGAVQQQNLLSQLANAQAAVNQQRLGYQSQQAQQALSLAQQLSGQDLNLQQLNYGGQQDYYNNIVNALTGKANFDQNNMNNQTQIMQQAAQMALQNNQFNQQQLSDQQSAQAKAQQQAIDNANSQLKILIDAANAGLTVDPNTGQVTNNNSGVDMSKLTDPGSKLLYTALNFTNNDMNAAQKYIALVQAQAATPDFNAGNPAVFAQAVAQAADANGLNYNTAYNIALQGFTSLGLNSKGN